MLNVIQVIVIPIIIAVIGSGGFFTFIQFCISHHDREFEKKITANVNELKNTIDFVALGCTRTQLLVLMTHFSNRPDEIMKVAHRYFVEMKGNWYLGTLFKDWCKENKHEIPEWFNENV